MWVAYTLLLCPIKMGSVSGVWKFVIVSADIHTMGAVSMSSFVYSLYIYFTYLLHLFLYLACMHLYMHMYTYVYLYYRLYI